MTINDRDLLYYGENDSTNGVNPYSEEFMSDLKRMKSIGIDISFENDIETEDNEENSNAHLYEAPLTDFDPVFEKDLPNMKDLGLPLSFCNQKGSEHKVAQFKIVGPSNEFSTFDNSCQSSISKWEPVNPSAKIEMEFQKYWMQHGEAIVRQKLTLCHNANIFVFRPAEAHCY